VWGNIFNFSASIAGVNVRQKDKVAHYTDFSGGVRFGVWCDTIGGAILLRKRFCGKQVCVHSVHFLSVFVGETVGMCHCFDVFSVFAVTVHMDVQYDEHGDCDIH
jgi:hypothetical protein